MYAQQHDSAFPGKQRAELSIDFRLLTLEYLLQRSGTGYFRARVVQRYIEEKRLFPVPNAPEFTYPIYVIYRDSDTPDIVHQTIARLRAISQQKIIWR